MYLTEKPGLCGRSRMAKCIALIEGDYPPHKIKRKKSGLARETSYLILQNIGEQCSIGLEHVFVVCLQDYIKVTSRLLLAARVIALDTRNVINGSP